MGDAAAGLAAGNSRDSPRQTRLAHPLGEDAIHVAASIAGRVIRRPLPGMPEVTLNLIREALELAAGSPQLRIHLHPSDHDALVRQRRP